ncbi:M23 family metallopeptidase [bacterium]|nr:M23 family metallopeptidase [bacterium]
MGKISSRYGGRYGQFHTGIDITDSKGNIVRAAESGEIVFIGNKKALGKAVVIDHGDGFRTVYGHNSRIYVKRGMRVKQGQKISKMGASGRSTGIHLHFEVRVNKKHVNPLQYLPSR